MSTYQSVQSATVDNDNTLVITKPTSLAVGDLMVAGIWADRDAGSSASISTPSGWTLEELLDTGIGNGALAVFSKVADSADVAASNFTFTGTGSTTQMHMIGHLLRITNFGQKAGEASAASGATSTTLTITGFTPSPAITEALYIAFAGRSDVGTPGQVTSIAMATSNPTWTERAESTVNGSTTDSTFAVYTANRTATTATGDFTVTFATVDNTRTGGIVIALNPRVDGSFSAPDTKVNAYALTPIQSVVIDAVVDAPTITSMNMPAWSNPTKPSTTWINTDK
jgi:hypothetical protein